MIRIYKVLVAWGALVAVGGSCLFSMQLPGLLRDVTSEWQPVQGRVVEVVESTRQSGRVSIPTLRASVLVPIGDGATIGHVDVPVRLRAQLTPGASLRVFVAPDAPHQLLLEPPTMGLFLVHVIGMPILIVLGIGSFFLGIHLLRRGER